jgi:glyoxylase-like metal-dependent hydrolase (beta-lactamase superfamily II)
LGPTLSSAAPVASLLPPTWTPKRIQVGPWTITALMDAWFRLDGGAMWGVVPKVLWERMTPPLADNTILLAARPYLAQRDGLNVIVEGGMGGRWNEKQRAMYHVDLTYTLESTLAAVGVGLDDIDHVVASHCHFDHIGALVVDRGGALEPLFPRALHHFPAKELAASRVPAHPRRASYRSEDLQPIEASGRLALYSGESTLFDGGLQLVEVGGHSEGMTVLRFRAEGSGPDAAFWGDLVPTTHHIQPPYIMAYDVDVPRSFAMRTEWLARWADEGLVGLSYHDPDRPFTTLVRDGKRYVANEYGG